MPEHISLMIDGQSVAVPAGTTLRDAIAARGIETPTLCFDPELTPPSACRICVVELKGSRVLVPSCSRVAENGMEVYTDSPRVRRARKGVIELLQSSVDVSLAPTIQRFAQVYGAQPDHFGGGATVEQPARDADNWLYVRDYARCILCYKCVEACGSDVQKTFALTAAGRGFDAHIDTGFDAPLGESPCVYCGNCVAVCPTGALMGRTEYEMRHAGSWDESQQKQVDSICSYCGVGCELRLHVQNNQIVKVSSPREHPVTHGFLCVKGRFGYEYMSGGSKRRQEALAEAGLAREQGRGWGVGPRHVAGLSPGSPGCPNLASLRHSDDIADMSYLHVRMTHHIDPSCKIYELDISPCALYTERQGGAHIVDCLRAAKEYATCQHPISATWS